MHRTRRPPRPGDASPAPFLARRAAKPERDSKRSRSPCVDELAFQELRRQRRTVQQRIQQQSDVLLQLERNVLDFYCTHTVRFEPLLEPPADAASGGVDGEAASWEQLAVVFPELRDSTTLADACNGDTADASADAPPEAAVVPTHARYYYDSVLMRLYRESAVQERDLSRQCASEAARVAALERSVRHDIVEGTLAAQLRTEREEQDALRGLTDALSTVESHCEAHQASLRATELRVAEMERARELCLARTAVLEAAKQEQMDNAGRIKAEVTAFRSAVEAAANDLERRKHVNRSLEDEISRRRAAMRRRRRE
ncbi:hypothetical protein NESM_000138100 [Novymonas esmeraldas]|uniref:Uncharacterized protein n=1 Tax=Novymonas esmeraldas TaxID=1808958 RepID=A0AAW0F3A0_9TRYP